ncbi:MAG: HD domain-containing protein [Candidatus Aphodocola sp.]
MSDVKNHFEKLGNQFITNKNDYLKLIPSCKQFNEDDVRIIYKALYKAIELHKDSKPRKSGEAYITHPIAVSSVLAGYGLDGMTVASALLHDTIEDTSYTLKDCENDFGTTITTLVDGVTKIGKDVNAATHEKIIKSVDKDVRSIAIKVADRLHNMYTLEFLKPSKQIEISTETKDFYVPITKILGIYQLKDELQDLSLYYLNNDLFLKYEKKRNRLKNKYLSICDELGDEVQDVLSKSGIAMNYSTRVKNIGAIYEELENGKNINEIDDLLAIKMVLTNPIMCYQALGVVHELGRPVVGKLEDFIALPKENGYRSLNTNIKYKDADIQVRIRTDKMQGTNNLGVFSDLNDDIQKKVNSSMRKSLRKLQKNEKDD